MTEREDNGTRRGRAYKNEPGYKIYCNLVMADLRREVICLRYIVKRVVALELTVVGCGTATR